MLHNSKSIKSSYLSAVF